MGALAAGCSRPARPADRRLRIEHAQHIAPKDFDRFAAMKVIASVQPYHAIDDVFSIPAARLKDVQVLTTIAGGKIVHQRRL